MTCAEKARKYSVVGEKNAFSESVLGLARLSDVYTMAQVIKNGIEIFATAKNNNVKRYL